MTFARSFNSKMMFLVVVPTLVTTFFVLTIVLFVYNRLSDDSSSIINRHMKSLYTDFITESSRNIAINIRQRTEEITHELNMLAGTVQTLIDMGADAERIGEELQRYDYYRNDFAYNRKQNWSNIEKGDADISISVWGYQHDAAGQVDTATRSYAATLSTLKPFMHAIGKYGVQKGWLYIVGPKSAPLMMMYPWAQMPALFDETYPGHNVQNWWDFFFPNMVEGWEKWIHGNAGPLADGTSQTTITPFYDDAGGAGVMLTFFHPLWNAKRDANAGAVAIDVNIGDIARIVQEAKLGKQGFSFIMTSDGDMLGLSDEQCKLLGVHPKGGPGAGVNTLTTNIFSSSIPSFASIKLPGKENAFTLYDLSDNADGCYLALRSFAKVFRWNGATIDPVMFFVGVIAPKSEAGYIQSAIQEEIASASSTSILFSIVAACAVSAVAITLSLLVVSYSVKQIKLLKERAISLSQGDFRSQAPVISHDELGQLALAFNSMTNDLSNSHKQIQEHAENLEHIVAQRTQELETANKLLEELSLTDSLTGLRNRRHFDETLRLLWSLAQREGAGLALILFDVDFFKKYNDRYGHQSGDACLRRIAGAARRCARRDLDQICRYGGEEFAVLMLGRKEDAALIGERIRQAVEDERIPHEQGTCPFVTISLGCAFVERFEEDSPEKLLSRADAALYQSKREGRNRLTVL